MIALVLAVQLACAVDEPPTLSLDDAIASALAHHPRVQVAEAALVRAQADVGRARANALPSLFAKANYTRLDDDRKLGDRVLVPKDVVAGALHVDVPLVSAERWFETAQASDAVAATRVDGAEVRRTLVSLVARAHVGVLGAHEVLVVVTRARDVASDLLKLSEKRAAEGVGTRLDVVRAQRELEDDEARLALAHSALVQSQLALGLAAGSEGPLDAQPLDATTTAPPVDDDVTASIDARSDVKALGLRAQLAHDRLAWRGFDFLPTLTLSAEPFFQVPASTTTPALGWQAVLALNAPLYDGGLRFANHDAWLADAQLDDALLREAHDGALVEVRTARARVHATDDALGHARKSHALADEAATLAAHAYAEGAASNQELIDAQRSARDAGSAAVQAQNERDLAVLELKIALGLSLTAH